MGLGIKILIFFLFIFLIHFFLNQAKEENHPHSKYSGKSNINENQVDKCDINTYMNLKSNYLRLVNYILNNNEMHHDISSKSYHRILNLKISETDLEKINRYRNNPTYLDSVIFEIFQNSVNEDIPTKFIGSYYFIIEKFHYLTEFFSIDDVQYILIVFLFLISTWILSKYMRRGLILTAISLMFITSYIIDYRRCGQEKEIKSLLELDKQLNNPCEIKQPKNFIEQIKQFFIGYTDDDCVKFLLNKNKSILFDKFCEPFEHFIDFVFYKNIYVFFDKTSTMFMIFVSKKAFPLNILFGIMFLYFCRDLLKYTFKYSFMGLFNGLNSPKIDNQSLNNGNANKDQPINVAVHVHNYKSKKNIKVVPVQNMIGMENDKRIDVITNDGGNSATDSNEEDEPIMHDDREEVNCLNLKENEDEPVHDDREVVNCLNLKENDIKNELKEITDNINDENFFEFLEEKKKN